MKKIFSKHNLKIIKLDWIRLGKRLGRVVEYKEIFRAT